MENFKCMKKVFALALLAVGLTACNTMNRAPYSGGLGEYGFTYDLDGSPSPFVDTSYRPLTVYDLAAPSVVIVTNRPPPREVTTTGPEIGVTKYAGESPTRVVVSGAQPGSQGQAIDEASGAARAASGAGGYAPAAGAAAPGAGRYGGYGVAPGVAVLLDGNQTNVIGITNTNQITNSISLTNTNNIIFTNTNNLSFATNSTNQFPGTNLNFAATNNAINEPAGTARPTNDFRGQPFPAQRTAPTPSQSVSNGVTTFNNSVNPPAAAQRQDRNLLNQNPPAGNVPVAPPQVARPPQTVAPRQGGVQPQPR